MQSHAIFKQLIQQPQSILKIDDTIIVKMATTELLSGGNSLNLPNRASVGQVQIYIPGWVHRGRCCPFSSCASNIETLCPLHVLHDSLWKITPVFIYWKLISQTAFSMRSWGEGIQLLQFTISVLINTTSIWCLPLTFKLINSLTNSQVKWNYLILNA